MRQGTLTDHDVLPHLNKVLETCSQLDWIGRSQTFSQAITTMRFTSGKAFQDDDNEDAEGGPIEEDENEAFFEFLESWGI